jgi:hypothetical protein
MGAVIAGARHDAFAVGYRHGIAVAAMLALAAALVVAFTLPGRSSAAADAAPTHRRRPAVAMGTGPGSA